MKHTRSTNPSHTSQAGNTPPASRGGRRRARILIGLLALAAAGAVTSCSITIDGFAQEAATELGEDVAELVTAAAANSGRTTTDYDLVAAALHTVVDLDDYDDDDYRPTHSGLSDADGDGLDDDGRVEVRVAGARACVYLTGVIDVDSGRCPN